MGTFSRKTAERCALVSFSASPPSRGGSRSDVLSPLLSVTLWRQSSKSVRLSGQWRCRLYRSPGLEVGQPGAASLEKAWCSGRAPRLSFPGHTRSSFPPTPAHSPGKIIAAAAFPRCSADLPGNAERPAGPSRQPGGGDRHPEHLGVAV